MKRTYRLRRSDQFQRVRRDGQTYNHHILRLNVAPNNRRKVRCGFIVSKHIGNAVQRNRARRRVREAVRLVLDHIHNGNDLVFIIRKTDVSTIAFPVLQDVVEHLLRRAHIWNE